MSRIDERFGLFFVFFGVVTRVCVRVLILEAAAAAAEEEEEKGPSFRVLPEAPASAVTLSHERTQVDGI